MAFFKKNPLLCIIILVGLLAFGAGAFLAVSTSGKVAGSQRTLNSAQSQLKGLLASEPAPTAENRNASQQNIDELLARLGAIRADLQRGTRLKISEDSVGVMAAIQQYISEFQRMASDHKGNDGQPKPIKTPPEFGFGFEQYLKEARPYDDVNLTRLLDKQRQILSFLLIQLINANPDTIDAVEREVRELRSERNKPRGDLQISPAISAQVPGAIDTLAFRLTFTGYTDVLRSFINSLSAFELPIVVRSVEVTRPSGRETVAVNPTERGGLEALFGGLGMDAQPQETVTEAQKPIISENISKFIVTVEFIEVVLPAAAPAAAL